MNRRITVQDGETTRDWEVSGLPDGATAAGLLAAAGADHAASELGETPADRIRDGTILSPEAPAPSPEEGGQAPIAALYALSGPQAGRVWKLSPGRYAAGDSPAADIRLQGVAPASLTVDGRGAASWRGRPFPAGSLRAGPHRLRIAPWPGGTAPDPPEPRSFFNRPPRHLPQRSDPPPEAPVRERVDGKPRRMGAVMFALPVIAGAGMALFFGRLMFLTFALMSPLMMAGQSIEDRRRRRRETRRAGQKFAADLREYARRLRRRARCEQAQAHLDDPSLGELLAWAEAGSRRLWERRPAHPDFLRATLGYGTVRWAPPPGGEEEPEAAEALRRHGVMHGVPVTAQLAPGRILGVAAPREKAASLAGAVLCQIAVTAGPADVRIGVITDRPEVWDWVKWTPHSLVDARSDIRLLACSATETEALLSALSAPAAEGPAPVTVIAVDHPRLSEDHRRLLRRIFLGTERPAAGVWLEERAEELPAACAEVAELGATARLRRPGRGAAALEMEVADAAQGVAEAAARRLARWEDPEAAAPGSRLPERTGLLEAPELSDLSGATDRDGLAGALSARWSAAPSGLAAPVGVSEAGTVLVDLAADGPHCLVAGTTGAGKSELLRTLIASWAARYSPEFLNLILIDYKGGAAFDACADLPHTTGLVTDLDESLGERALRSLEAELTRREERLRAAGASDIDQLRSALPDRPLPRLAVIVDEFALLSRELPDFMEALVDIAQRGRSLGVHLVLATQRPAGVVKDSIRANVNLRICLRVQTPADSRDVLGAGAGSGLAAGIPPSRPGRGYIRSGPEAPVPFQTALVSGSGSCRPAVRATPFLFAMRQPTASPVPDRNHPSQTDLARLAAAAARAWKATGRPAPRRPWSPPLNPGLTFGELPAATGGPDDEPEAALGVADQPDRQRQVPWKWRPAADGALLLIGRSGAGPQDGLLATACSLASVRDPDRLRIYGLDSGKGRLAELENLPHVGSIVPMDDEERLERALELFRRRMEESAPPPERPWLVLLADDLGGLRPVLEKTGLAELFGEICRAGPARRVGVAAAADGARAVPPSLSSVFVSRLVFSLADPLDWSLLGVRAATDDPPPRRAVDARTGECVQIAAVATADVERAGRRAAGSVPVPAIPSLPRRVPLESVAGAGVVTDREWRLPLGLDGKTLQPAVVTLYGGDHLLIAGPRRSGRSTALWATASAARMLDPDVRLAAVCPRPSPLADHPGLRAVFRRIEDLTDLVDDEEEGPRTVVLIDDAEETADHGPPDRIIERRAEGITVVAAGRNDVLRAAHRHWTRALRAGRRGVILSPEERADGDLFGVRLPSPRTGPLPGRGFLVDGGDMRMIQMAVA